MNTRIILLLGSLLPLAACDFDPKDIGDPSGDTVESAGSTGGYSSDGPESTSQGSATSTTGADPTGATSTTGADPTATGTTGDDSTSNGSSTTGADPTATSTSTTGDDSTSNGSSTASTTTMGPPDTTSTGEPSTTTSTTGEEPGPVMCNGDPNTFPVFDKQCETKADCVAVLHTIDCCGSQKILGINADAVDEFNAAEALCTSQEPNCDCAPNAPVAEDGNSVLVPEDATLACTDGVCSTFVI